MMPWGRARGSPRKEAPGLPLVQWPKDPEPVSGPGYRGHGGEARTPPSQFLPLGLSLSTKIPTPQTKGRTDHCQHTTPLTHPTFPSTLLSPQFMAEKVRFQVMKD